MKKISLIFFLFFFIFFTTTLLIIASDTHYYEYITHSDKIIIDSTETSPYHLVQYILYNDNVSIPVIDTSLEHKDEYIAYRNETIKSDTDILLKYLSSITSDLLCTEMFCLFKDSALTPTITLMILSAQQGIPFYVDDLIYIYPPYNIIEYIKSHGFPIPYEIYSDNVFIWNRKYFSCYC